MARSMVALLLLASGFLQVVRGDNNIDVEKLVMQQNGAYHTRLQQGIDKINRHKDINQHAVDPDLIKALQTFKPQNLLSAAPAAGISEDCSNALLFILETNNTGLSPFEMWNLKYFDSWGKPSDGILEGHFKWPGMFDECMNISVSRPINSSLLSDDLKTKYCTMYIPVIPNLITVQIGLCSPKQCTNQDLSVLWNSVMGKIAPGGASCQDQDYTMTGGQKFVLVFVCVLIGVCVLATLVDGTLQFVQSWNSSTDGETPGNAGETTPLLGGSGAIQQPKRRQNSGMEQSLPVKALLAFSIYTNSKKLFNTSQPADTITCLNGIRFLSMTWVILGHTLLLLNFSLIENSTFAQTLVKRFSAQAVLNAPFSVDTFFVLSGFLVAYLFMRDFKKRKIQIAGFFKALPLIYLHRYLRLTPAYGIMIMIYTSLLWFSFDGPNWPNWPKPPVKTFDQNCDKYWWTNILYVNNLFHINEQCAGWGWYLANDTQFFLFAPFLVFLFYLSMPVGLAATIASILGSMVAAIVVSDQQRIGLGLIPGLNSGKENFTHVNSKDIKYPEYFVPWTRFQSYGVGILAGLILWKLKDSKFKLPKITNLLVSLGLWGVAAALCMSTVYGPYAGQQGEHIIYLGEADAYNGLSRTAWSIGVSLVIILCSMGNGGWINEFLSWGGFIPVSRLTYAAYLIHLPILGFISGSKRHGKYYNDLELALDALLVMTVSYMVAYVFSMLFEAPYINLDKLFLTPHSLRHDRDNQQQTPDHQQQSAANSSTTGGQPQAIPHPSSTSSYHTTVSSEDHVTIQPHDDLPPKYEA